VRHQNAPHPSGTIPGPRPSWPRIGIFILAALDVHPRVAMRILRHAQIDVTMNVYTDVSDAKTLLKRLGKQLARGVGRCCTCCCTA
jgi:hypothetical protein